MIKERTFIQCLLGGIPFKKIEGMNDVELFSFFESSYFHFWKSIFPDQEDAFKTLRKLVESYIKENECEDLDNAHKWLLCHLKAQMLIANAFNFVLLIDNINATLEELLDADIEKIEEDVNLIAKIITEINAINYILRYSRFKDFEIKPSLEADVLPSFIKNQSEIKKILKDNYSIQQLPSVFVDNELGEVYLDKSNTKEIYTLFSDLLIFKVINMLMIMVEDLGMESDDVFIESDELEAFADFALESILNDMLPESVEANEIVKDAVADLLIAAIFEDLLVSEVIEA